MRMLERSMRWYMASSTIASTIQVPLTDTVPRLLQFDDIKTADGWSDVPANYSDLVFEGFLTLRPDAPALQGLIFEYDLNCAVSIPNGIYGTRFNQQPPAIPEIVLAKDSKYSSFALISIKIKPLTMPPLGFTKLKLRATRVEGTPLDWSVDFPHGFHDIFTVILEEFSGTSWSGLRSLQITADFVKDGRYMDWEFCFDDLEVVLES